MTTTAANTRTAAPAIHQMACEAGLRSVRPWPKPPAATPAPPTAAATGAAAGATKPSAASAAAVSWTKPEAWEKVDHPSSMRKATFKIKKAEGDTEDDCRPGLAAGHGLITSLVDGYRAIVNTYRVRRQSGVA